MAKSKAERPNAHRRLKVQVAVWSATTGRPQYELAQELGITKVYLSRILNGHRGGRYWLDRIDEMTRINRSA
ncbi:MAG: helix-turn-helix domain-containing protein [Oscillospiraceae bacterium]|nr:helix-turn-helix domain-containing protein [Oscillospiraceae bacterium]MDY3218356.1 helix-turn-helix transcriptional regulator [Candidatus Fimivivens sp.]